MNDDSQRSLQRITEIPILPRKPFDMADFERRLSATRLADRPFDQAAWLAEGKLRWKACLYFSVRGARTSLSYFPTGFEPW